MIKVRPATISDVDRVFELIHAIADHHGQSRFVRTNADEIRYSGFGDNPRLGVLLAEFNEQVVGFLSYTIDYSIWLGSDYFHIDDVYVDADFRGRNIGEALMLAAKERCNELGLDRLKWEVQTENAAARRFYERLGEVATTFRELAAEAPAEVPRGGGCLATCASSGD